MLNRNGQAITLATKFKGVKTAKDMKPFVDAKQADIDGFLSGAADWVRSVRG